MRGWAGAVLAISRSGARRAFPRRAPKNRSSMTRDPLAAGDLIAERRFVYAKPSGNGRRNRSQNYRFPTRLSTLSLPPTPSAASRLTFRRWAEPRSSSYRSAWAPGPVDGRLADRQHGAHRPRTHLPATRKHQKDEGGHPVTAQRRTDPRTKQGNRRQGRLKSGAVRSARRQAAASTVRSTALPPPTPGGVGDRRAARETVAVSPLGREGARRAFPPTEPSLLERAERLRDDLLRSKLTHPDPWSYTAKARAWGERAQALVEEIVVVGETPALHATVTKLATEVEGDADFQKARQLF